MMYSCHVNRIICSVLGGHPSSVRLPVKSKQMKLVGRCHVSIAHRGPCGSQSSKSGNKGGKLLENACVRGVE